jgi:putative acetyltransferase
MKRIETERLILRKFTQNDLEDFFEYASLATVGPRAGWIPHPDLNHSQKILTQFILSDEVWAMEIKSISKVIGSVGIHFNNLQSVGEVHEIGYVMSTNYENKGYMTEAVNAVLKHVFLELNLESLYVGHFIGNTKSQKLINRFPFRYLKDEDYESRDYGMKSSKLYVMTKEDYFNNGGKK